MRYKVQCCAMGGCMHAFDHTALSAIAADEFELWTRANNTLFEEAHRERIAQEWIRLAYSLTTNELPNQLIIN